jgi:hypothetical protein
MVCEVYLGLRDYANSIHDSEPGQYSRIMNLQGRVIQAADVLMRGLARVGIIALVDEATGYQEDRAKDELTKILKAYISPKLLPWTQKFPHEFFRQVYRLHGWPYKPGSVKHPKYLGKFINKYVYGQFPPGVLEALQEKNPVTESGYRRHRNHQFLTVDTGDPHLDRVIIADITLMQVSDGKGQFLEFFDKAIGKPQQMKIPFDERPPLIVEVEGEKT